MEKVFEQSLDKPLKAVQDKIGKRVVKLNKKYHRGQGNNNLLFTWNKKKNTLILESDQFQIRGKIKFTQKKVKGYIEIPGIFRPLALIYQKKIVKEIQKEINLFIEKL